MNKKLSVLMSVIMFTLCIPIISTEASISTHKTTALRELTSIFTKYDSYYYLDSNWLTMESIFNTTKDNINNATTEEDVYKTLNDGAEALIAVPHRGGTVKVCFTAEMLTLHRGFITEPEYITTRRYTSVADLTVNYYEDIFPNTYTPAKHTGTTEHNFELTGIKLLSPTVPNIDKVFEVPLYIQSSVGCTTLDERSDYTYLRKGDYTPGSSFVYSINNMYPNVKASAIPVDEEDVIKWQFSLYGNGADVGSTAYNAASPIYTAADKTIALWLMADINRQGLELLLTDADNLYYYTEAIKAIHLPNVSQNAVDKATQKLKKIKPVEVKPSAAPQETKEPVPTEPPTEETPQNPIPSPTPSATPRPDFTDVDDKHFAKESINYLLNNNIINGRPDGSFGVNDTLTRAELAAMIFRASNDTNDTTEGPFDDVSSNDWFYDAVNFCFKNNIVNGQSEDTFNPHAYVSRQDLATMLYRYSLYKNKELNGENRDAFSDDVNIAEYAKDAVYALYESNIISGYEGNIFNPQKYATRAETAKILYGILKQ